MSIKKALMCMFAFVASVDAQVERTAEETKLVEKIKEDTRMVRYTITIYRDPELYDDSAWKKTVDEAADTIESVTSGDDQDGEAVVTTVLRSLQNICKKSTSLGINGSISISLGDGNCPEEGKGCNSPCLCKQDYRGLCPCSLDTTRSCKTAQDCACATKGSSCCKSSNGSGCD